jgi:hypothetical protein
VPPSHDPMIVMFHCLLKSHCSPCHPVMIQWSECSIVFSLFWKFHCSPCRPVIRMFHCLFIHCFENLTVLHAIQSWPSDQNVPLSFHFLENLTVLHLT